MISYGRQDVSAADIDAVTEVMRGDWLTTGPTVERFEVALQEWLGGTSAVAVSSGTAALHAAYAAAGLGPGDEVISPPITFVATQAAFMHLGAAPVFADVEPDTACLDPRAVEAAIGPRTTAVVAVDYAGHPADMISLREVADRHKILLIEDAAHSLGSQLDGVPTGALADITTFSFFPTKNITTGEGGAVASPHTKLLDRARLFSRQGLVRDSNEFVLPNSDPWHQEVHELGLNYRLSDIHAALGLSQLGRLSEFRESRSLIKSLYDEVFADLAAVSIPVQRANARPVWHLYPLRVLNGRRRELYDYLLRRGVRCQVNYLPAYRHPALRSQVSPADFPNSELFYAEELSLPIYSGLSEDQALAIAEVVREWALNE